MCECIRVLEEIRCPGCKKKLSVNEQLCNGEDVISFHCPHCHYPIDLEIEK